MRSTRALLHALLLSSQVGCALGARRIKHRANSTKDATGDAVEAGYAQVVNTSSPAAQTFSWRQPSAISVTGARSKSRRATAPGGMEDTFVPRGYSSFFEPPEVIDVLRTLPHFRKRMSGNCFVLTNGDRLGCRDGCKCLWYERCYPQYVLWRGERGKGDMENRRGAGSMNSTITSLSQDGELMSIDVGTCAWSMHIMVLVSVAAFLLTTMVVVFLRMCLLLIVDIKEHFSNPKRDDASNRAPSGAPIVVPGRVKITSTFNVP